MNPNCPVDQARANANQSIVFEQKTEQAPPPRQETPPSPPRERRYMYTWMGPIEVPYSSVSGQYERPDPRDYDPSR